MRHLDALAAGGILAPIDVQLGGLLARRAAALRANVGDAQLAALAGAMVSAERGKGHSCVALDALTSTPAWIDTVGAAIDTAACRAALAASMLCGDGTAPTPLVLDGDRLYLYRLHAAERRLAAAIRSRLNTPPIDPPSAPIVALFRKLFSAGVSDSIDWQAVAAAAALRGRLTVITGGPGTGKTTTVARILALLVAERPDLRIALAAPTGKAAARLADAVQSTLAGIEAGEATRARIPREGRTLHRLLGYQPWDDRFAFDAERPLADDVIVVDEASMIDLLMMDALFAAIRPSSRIILLGDPEQLASVETGYVLGDVCRAAEQGSATHGASLATLYRQLSGHTLPQADTTPPLRDAVVRLDRSYRFEKQPGIGALADAIRNGDARRVMSVLASDECPDVVRRDRARSASELLAPIQTLVDDYLAATTPAEAMERFAGFRILTSMREGKQGVSGLNQLIESSLVARGVRTQSRWYHLRPVLITSNDPSTRLFNGDVGIAFSENGRTSIHFPDGANAVRAVSPARLPAHDTAWAMTVHKCQGSEFDHVLLVLPDRDNRGLTRELLYTGITRARRRVELIARTEIIEAAVAQTGGRDSGLTARLTM